MNRQEYIELVNDWNNFLLKEEKRILNEQLLIESILLSEVNVLNLAKKIGTSSAGLLVFFAAHLAQANPAKVVSNPDEFSRIPAKMSAEIESISKKAKAIATKEAEGIKRSISIAGNYDEKTGINELITTIVEMTSDNEDSLGISYGDTVNMKVLGRTITEQEQEVIDLLALFDTDAESFKKEIKNSKNISLLCSYGYCYTEWTHHGDEKYQLISPLSGLFISAKDSEEYSGGTKEIKQGNAVEFHNRANSVINDSIVKKMTSRIHMASSSNKPEMRQLSKAMNEFLLIYQKAAKKGREAKIKSASKTFPKMFTRVKKIAGGQSNDKVINVWEEAVAINYDEMFKGITEGYAEGVTHLYKEGHINEKHKSTLLSDISTVKKIIELLDIHRAIEDAIFYKIYGTTSVVKVMDMYKKQKAEKDKNNTN